MRFTVFTVRGSVPGRRWCFRKSFLLVVIVAAYLGGGGPHRPYGRCDAFLPSNDDKRNFRSRRWTLSQPQQQQQQCHRLRRRCSGSRMVRNIDLPEALILYGRDVCWVNNDGGGSLREGLLDLLEECYRDETAVIYIDDDQRRDSRGEDDDEAINISKMLPSYCTIRPGTVDPPNPRDLCGAVDDGSVLVRPRAFGGSSGFGKTQLTEPERPPMRSRTVVLVTDVPQTTAARWSGMRAIDVDPNDAMDNPLADAVQFVDAIDFGIDDISSPGSFWLNPPHPRDDRGDKVDPYEMMAKMESVVEKEAAGTAAKDDSSDAGSYQAPDEMDDDQLRSILNDMAPL